jgi:CRP-like cAMP-binding protein
MSEPLDEILQRSSFFRFLSGEHYQTLRAALDAEHFEFGEVIVKQGDEADALYILTAGRVRVVSEISSESCR